MVEFKESGYSIHIETGGNPIESWLDLQNELISLMALMDENVLMKPWRTLYFLQELLPDWETAKKMTEK